MKYYLGKTNPAVRFPPIQKTKKSKKPLIFKLLHPSGNV
jgi:hypothetical protein